MDNIYGWSPAKEDWKLIFEYVDWIEKIVDEDFIDDNSMIEDLNEIQNKIEAFYEKYLNDKPNRKWWD